MLLRLIAAIAILMFATPALADTAVSVPVDQAAHNRFPNANAATVDILAWLNRQINKNIVGLPDDIHYHGIIDQWVSFPPDGVGDCEDYATTKLVWLESAGFPVVSNTRLRFVMVKEIGLPPEGHVVLEVKLDDGSIAILDNMFDELMTRHELERTYGYTFYDW